MKKDCESCAHLKQDNSCDGIGANDLSIETDHNNRKGCWCPINCLDMWREKKVKTHYKIGMPRFFGKFPIRQDVTVLPADIPKGCVRISKEKPA